MILEDLDYYNIRVRFQVLASGDLIVPQEGKFEAEIEENDTLADDLLGVKKGNGRSLFDEHEDDEKTVTSRISLC